MKDTKIILKTMIHNAEDIKAHIESDLEYSKRISKIEMDDMWVCDYCGSEEVEEQVWRNMNTKEATIGNDYHQCVNCEESCTPITYFNWQEKIAEECMGNKDKYDKIMDGSRA